MRLSPKAQGTTIATAVAVTLLAGVASAGLGRDPSEPTLQDHRLSQSIPEATALVALGLSLKQVIQTTPSLVLSPQILTGVDARGALQVGVGLESKPFLYWSHDDRSPEDHKQRYRTRLANRLGFSLAAAKAASNGDTALKLATGISLTPWDAGDPWLDEEFDSCLRRANPRSNREGHFHDHDGDRALREIAKKAEGLENQRSILVQQNAPAGVVELIVGELDDRIERYRERCRERAHGKLWNAGRWSLGVVPTWIGRDGRAGSLKWGTAVLWSSLAYGFSHVDGTPVEWLSRNLQIVFGMQYLDDENVSRLGDVRGDGLRSQDRWVAGAQLRWAVQPPSGRGIPNLIFAVESDYIYRDVRNNDKEKEAIRISGSIDYRVVGGAFLNMTIGGSASGGEDEDDAFLMSTLKFAF